jgi:hypothetical protein
VTGKATFLLHVYFMRIVQRTHARCEGMSSGPAAYGASPLSEKQFTDPFVHIPSTFVFYNISLSFSLISLSRVAKLHFDDRKTEREMKERNTGTRNCYKATGARFHFSLSDISKFSSSSKASRNIF